MQKRLDNTQLENVGLNCSNLKEEDLECKKKYMRTHVIKPLFHMSKEEKKIYFIYIDIRHSILYIIWKLYITL